MIKHLIYHVTPLPGADWNIDELVTRWHLFNGKKIIAVAQGDRLEDISFVVEKFPIDPELEIFPIKNDLQLREVASFPELLKRLHAATKEYAAGSQDTQVTFYGHTKGVSRSEFPSAKLWTAALYYFNLDQWDKVEQTLKLFKTAGSFVSYKWYELFPSNCSWHYSGTFFWFRNLDLFSKPNWRDVHQTRYGAEGYLGSKFRQEEAGLIFGNNVQDLYDFRYLKKLLGPENIKRIEKACAYKLPLDTFRQLPIKRSAQKKESISIVVTSHGEAKDLPVMLGSIENQRDYIVGKHSRDSSPVYWVAGDKMEWPLEVVITHDGEFPTLTEYHAKIEEQHSFKIKVLENPKQGKVGHNTRTPGILAAEGDWIVLTNSDNYFVQGWLAEISKHMKPTTGVIYWNGINNLHGWQAAECRFERGWIDLSFAIVRSEIAKEVKFPFKDYDGDFDYLSACAKLSARRKLNVVKVRNVLSVHQ